MRRLAQRVLAALAFLGVTATAGAQTPAVLNGTLLKVRDAGFITLGHRESSIPFSYRSARGEPIGYSIDLCKLLVDAISETVGKQLTIKWKMVTPETRINAVALGEVDLECGSTTANLERRKEVAFSPTMFVSGTKLLVKRGSPIKSFRDLGGKRVVVTAGTTNEKTMHDLAAKFKIDMAISSTPDHAASFAELQAGKVDAFATDDVLLYGLVAEAKAQRDYVVVGDFLSYDPYGIMYRKADPQLAQVINETFHSLAEDRELERRYEQWFLKKLPSGVTINLPMSAQLETIIQTMAARPENE